MNVGYLLSVDLGIKTGLALFDKKGCLIWCRSHNFGDAQRLKRAVHNILEELSGLRYLVIEGGGRLAEAWKKEADKRGISVIETTAETWRSEFFTSKKQRNAKTAKASAVKLATELLKDTDSAYKKNLNHNTAEAVLIGLWAVSSGILDNTGPEKNTQ